MGIIVNTVDKVLVHDNILNITNTDDKYIMFDCLFPISYNSNTINYSQIYINRNTSNQFLV